MKVEAQLAVMMLAYLGPIGLAYTAVTGRNTTQIFWQDLKVEARVAQRILNASVTSPVARGDWDEVS
jgi:hypothetical protein